MEEEPQYQEWAGEGEPQVESEEPATHHTTVLGVCALEVACHSQNGFTEVSYQLCLLDILGFERLQVVLP